MVKLTPPKLFCCHSPVYEGEQVDTLEIEYLFEKAVAESESIVAYASTKVLIKLYSLFKQATEGDINIEPPATNSNPNAKTKYKAWYALKGKSKKEAQLDYIHLVYENKV